MDSAALVAQGVRIGSAVTASKCASRLGETSFTARALDDRVGTTALVLALGGLAPDQVKGRTIFAWVTREEIGLQGAAALAAQLGTSVRRVHAVDTFVSSDSPLESPRYAFTPLGAGAVIRVLDGSSIAPPHEVIRIETIARRRGIPVQAGTTSGSNDGSTLAKWGAVNIPLSWPGRYSHSPVEVADLRDVTSLVRLITALAREPAGDH
jgi:putative aminopeptidase FrvX